MHRLTQRCVRWPKTTLVTAGVLVLLSLWAGTGVKTVAGTRAQLGGAHPDVLAFERFVERFGGGYPVLIAWSCEESEACAHALDRESVAMARTLSSRLEKAPYVRRVTSPANVPVFVADGEDALRVHRLGDEPEGPSAEQVRHELLTNPLYRGSLVSADGRVGALVVEASSMESDAHFAIVDAIEEELRSYESAGFVFHEMGQPVVEVAIHRDTTADATRVAAATGLFVAVTLLLLTGTWQAALTVMVAVGAATAFLPAALVLLGWERDPLINAAPTMTLVIGSATAIYVISRYAHVRQRVADPARAMVFAARDVSPACFMTTATTMIGFLSFAANDSFAMWRFGCVAALGIGLACLACFSLVPVLLLQLPESRRATSVFERMWTVAIRWSARASIRHARAVLAAGALVTAVMAVGIARLEVEADLFGLWRAEERVPRDADFMTEHLRGPDSLEIAVELPAGATLDSAGAFAAVARTVDALERIDGLGRPRSIVDAVRTFHRAATGQPTGEDTALSGAEIGEALGLAFVSDGSAVDAWVQSDLRGLRLSVPVDRMVNSKREAIDASVRSILARTLPAGSEVTLTGPLILDLRRYREVLEAMIGSLTAATLFIFAIIAVYLRSLRWGVLAMIPNVVPIVVMLGSMGTWGVMVDAGSAMVGPIALGIAVDDTLHILSEYAVYRRKGEAPEVAIRSALEVVGRPAITTALALALGFASMATSHFQSVINIGVLSAVTIVTAMLSDLFLTTALVAVFGRFTR